MTYILFIALSFGTTVTATAEFNNLEACKEAAAQIKKDMSPIRTIFTCVKKGEKS